jgi:hypothetical protein
MPSDTYILTISDAGVSVPSSHASTHITGGSDAIPTATSSTSGLMSAAIFNQHVTNTAKVENKIHTGDVTDAAGVLTVNRINGVALSSFPNNTVLKTTTGGIIAAATASDYPTLNQSTTGNALTATTATKSTNIAGGATGSLPYQTANDSTAMLAAGTSGTVLKSNGAAPPSWSQVNLSSETTGTLQVASGGTGAATFTAGVLKANGTSSFTTVPAPAGNLVGTSDSQILTNKLLGSGTTFSTAIGVVSGGTGATTFTAGILRADGTNAFTTSTAPAGDLVGTTASQLLTNKTLGSNTTFSSAIGVGSGGTGLTSYTTGDLIYANSSSSLAKLLDVDVGNVLISGGVGANPSYGKVGLTTHVSGTLPVASGGTGATTLTGYVKGTGTTAMTAAATVPVADISGTLPVASGGTGATTLTGYVKGTGTTAMTAAATVPVADISGTLPVASGGTGATTLTGYVKGTGTTAMTAAATVPVADISGTLPVDKGGTSFSSYSIGDIVYANTNTTFAKLSSAGAGNVLLSGNTNNAPSYGKVGLTTHVSGTLPVASGGTGATTLTGYVKGTGTTAMTAAATVPAADISGTLPVVNGGTGAVTLTGYVKGSGTSVLTASSSIPASDITGTISVLSGGTGATAVTGSGLNVLSTSPTLVTPTLGTPTSGTLTNCTGLPLTTGVAGILPAGSGGTGTNSATGSGSVVLSEGAEISYALLIDCDLGVPTEGDLSYCSGLPLTTGVTGTLPVANGGTGLTTITGYVKGTGTSPLSTSSTIPVADISGTLPVAKGGTGATTLTGYIKGTGTTAMTAAATVPVADISGTLSVASGGTGLTASTARAIFVGGSASDTISQIATGNSGEILISQGSSAAPIWVRRERILSSSYTDFTTGGSTTEVTLNPYTLPASLFTTNGDTVDATYYLTRVGGSSSNNQYRVLFNGGTEIFNSGTTNTTSAVGVTLQVKITRTSSSAVRCSVTWLYAHSDGSSSEIMTTVTDVTSLTFTNTIALTVAALTGSSGSPIILRQSEVLFKPAP